MGRKVYERGTLWLAREETCILRGHVTLAMRLSGLNRQHMSENRKTYETKTCYLLRFHGKVSPSVQAV